MFMINTGAPALAIMFVAIAVLMIYLEKELKTSLLPQICLIISLVLLVIHAIQLFTLSPEFYDYRSALIVSMRFDYIFILINFIGYLWVDDIEAKAKDKKSVDNSLDWFWKKV